MDTTNYCTLTVQGRKEGRKEGKGVCVGRQTRIWMKKNECVCVCVY